MTMDLHELKPALAAMTKADERPVVLFSAVWPFCRATGFSVEGVCNTLHQILDDLWLDRTLMMPAFPGGFRRGLCNLDDTPSTTGALTEYFRGQPGVRRTVCAFFSFAVHGALANDLVSLRPRDAWGSGSLYEWIYINDAHIVTFGLHPTHCSFTHYAEWLARDRIPYRYRKTFEGEIVHEGRRFHLQQNLFVRSLQPEVFNDFTWLTSRYDEAGMRRVSIGGIVLSEIGARAKIDLITSLLAEDPLALVKNKEAFRKQTNGKHRS